MAEVTRPSVDMSEVPTNAFDIQSRPDADFSKAETYRESAFKAATMGAPLVAAGFVDTVGTSLGLIDENDVTNVLKQVLPAYGDYYARHKEVIQTVSDITGMFLPGMAAVKMIQSGAKVKSLLNGLKAGDKIVDAIFTSGKTADQLATQNLWGRALGLANNGVRMPTYEQQFAALKRGVTVTKVLDSVKETAAFELGVAATMHNSDTLYPSDWSLADNVLFNAGLSTIPVAGEYLYTQRAIRKIIQGMAEPAAEFLGQGAPRNFYDIIYQPGKRDLGVTLDATLSSASKQGSAAGSGIDDIGRDNLKKQALQLDSSIKSQVEKMGSDKPLADLTTSFKMNNTQVNTVMYALKEDPTSVLGTLSFEPLPKNYKAATDVLDKKKQATQKIIDQEIALGGKLQKLTPMSPEYLAEADKAKKLSEQRQLIDGVQFNSLEPTGEQIPIQLRKPRFYDGSFGVQIKSLPKSSDNATTTYVLEGINDEIFSPTLTEKVGFTADGFVLLPKAAPATQTAGGVQKVKVNVNVPTIETEKIINNGGPQVLRQNLKQKIDLRTAKGTPEFQSQLLLDAGKVWDFRSGQLGKDAFKQLHPNAQRLFNNWVGSSTNAQRLQLAAWEKDNTAEWQSIMAASEPFRKWMHERADAFDGTLLLFRGENSAKESSDIVSMSTNYNVAAGFANPDLLAIRVPIDDIIFPIGGLNEFEVVVKGHQSRKWGDVVRGHAPTEFVPQTVKVNKSVGTTTQTVEVEVPVQGGAPAGPINSFDELSYKARSSTWGLIKHAIDNYKPGTSPKLYIGEGDHFTRLSYARELVDKFGMEAAQNFINFPKAWQGPDLLDRLDFAILRGKYDSFLPLAQMMEEQAGGMLKLNESQLLNQWDLAHLLNLPANSNLEHSPVLGLFYQLRSQGVTDMADGIKDMNHVRRAMQEHVFMPEVTNFLNKDFAIHGNVLKAPSDASPVMMARKKLSMDDYKSNTIVNQMAQQKATVMDALVNAKNAGAELVGLGADTVLNSAAYQEARKVDYLIEGTQRGKGVFTQQSYANESNPTLAALNRITSASDREIEKWIGDQLEPFTQTFSQLRAKNNQASLFRFNQFEQSYRFGWDFTGEFEKGDDGFYRYVLQKNANNEKKWKQFFKEDMPESDKVYLPSMIGNTKTNPLLMDELAHQSVQAISNLSKLAGTNTDYLAKAMGRRGFNIRPIHLPPPNLSRENIAFLMTPDGRPKTVVYGRTPHELEANILKERDALVKENPELENRIVTNHIKDVEQYFDLKDDIFFEPINYADPLAQNARASGALGQTRLETGVQRLDDMIDSLRNHFFSVGRRSRAGAFISEIAQARMNHKIAGFPAQPEASIWNAYVNTIYGGSTLNPKTWMGIAYKSVEELYDKALAAVHDKVRLTNPKNIRELNPQTREFAARDKEFNRLKKELGGHNPFTDTLDFIKSTTKQELPSTMRQHMAALNNWTSTLTLRFMELGHPILNSVSLAATMPAVIRALERLPGETDDAWRARTGLYGSIVTDKVAMFNPSRAMVTTMHSFFNDDAFKAAMKRAGDAGYFRQDVAEMMRTITAPHENYWQNTIRAGVDRLSKLSDKSEELARQFTFGAGYLIARNGAKIENEKDLFLFANDFANKVIGDYRPQNRPQLFQGAVGMPLGLFQTFAWNYFQRLFSYIENRQWRALATQYATQAAVFGGRSVPGFTQFSDFLAAGHDGISNPVDGLQNRFGPEFADLLLYGTLSNIPKIFGADGISLYNRGDANLQRVPGLWSLGSTAPAQLAKNVWGALSDTVGAAMQGGLTPQRAMEILGTYSINKPIKYLMELGAGYSIDRSGEVISSDVRNGMSIASRIVGMRPMTESKSIETLNRIRATELAQANNMLDLREVTRSAIRGGNVDADKIVDGIRRYIENGGNPQGFGRWFRDQMIAATVNKADRKLLDVFNDPQKGYDTVRLMHLMSPLNDKEGE